MKFLLKVANAINQISEWSGKVGSLIVLPLMLIAFSDVIARYVFNSPLTWAWDIDIMLSGALVIFGAAYTLRHGGHIIIDVFLLKFSPKTRAIIDMVTSPIFFLSIGGLTWKAVIAAQNAVITGERYSSFFRPPLSPFRIALAIGLALLFLQGVSKFITDLSTAITPKEGSKL